MKNKTNTNFIIDAIMFICMMAIAGIGFLIKFTLVPGYKENEIYGRDVDLSFWGMDRHEWGRIHLTVSVIFLILLVFHIMLHWKMIVGLFKKLIKDESRRTVIAPLFVTVSFILIAFAFFIKPDVATSFTGSGEGYRRETITPVQPEGSSISADDAEAEASEIILEENADANETRSRSGHDHAKTYPVNGSMTLMEVNSLYDVPAPFILNELNIPVNTPENYRLGQLRRTYGFTMSEVEQIIILYKEN